MKNDNYNYNNKPCARCFSTVNRFDAERILVNTRGMNTELFFHYECFMKHEEGRAMVSRGVTGIEIDKNGDRINLETTFAQGNTFNMDKVLAKLTVALNGKSESEIVAFLNKIKD